MDNELVIELTSHRLASQLELPVRGPDIPITKILPLTDLSEGALCFCNSAIPVAMNVAATVIIEGVDEVGKGSVILSTNPRLDFARALAWIESKRGFSRHSAEPDVHPTVKVGEGTVIGRGAKIGAGTVINHHVVIGEGVEIGERCIIKSGAVIGEDGFGFERDESGVPIRLVHLGGVVIGNGVEIGSLTTVCRGTLGNTVIEDFVKTDDHVHIAHNVVVRRSTIITACAELSGGVNVGEEAWIGPNASVIQQRKIGDRALVGIAANVTKDVQDDTTVAGNPARPLKKN